MVDEDWGGADAHRRAGGRDDGWPPREGDDSDGAPGEGAPRGSGLRDRLSGWLGAATAVGLLVGLGAWTWDLAQRDLREVPVVRALEGPSRVAPDDPGGDVAEHQGLAVNAIQADREDDPEPERVVLAPSAQGLAEDDRAPARDAAAEMAPEREPEVAAASLGSAVGDPSSEDDPSTEAASPDPPRGGPSAIEAALAEALGVPAPEAEKRVVVRTVAVIDPEGGVSRSPRPSDRPAGGGVPAAEAVVEPDG